MQRTCRPTPSACTSVNRIGDITNFAGVDNRGAFVHVRVIRKQRGEFNAGVLRDLIAILVLDNAVEFRAILADISETERL